MDLPTKEQVNKYLKSSSCCLFCEDGDIEGGSVEVDGAGANQHVHCAECGKEWTDHYELCAVGIASDHPKVDTWYSDEAETVYHHERVIYATGTIQEPVEK